MRKTCYLRHLPTPVKQQRKPGDDKSSSQTALNFLRTVPRNPWRKKGCDITLNNEAVDGSHIFGLVIYTIFGALENHLIHVSGPLSVCGSNLLAILNRPVFTDQENVSSTFREEPPKMATFHGNGLLVQYR